MPAATDRVQLEATCLHGGPFDDIARHIDSPEAAQLPTAENRRAMLGTIGFLDASSNEWSGDSKNYVNGLFKMLHTQGAHPGLSD